MSELKKCPFCGGDVITSETTTDRENRFEFGWIGCQNCRVFINYINNERGKREAIAAWNRRAPSCDIQQYAESCADCGFCKPDNALRELVAAERDGRVVVLPCKVGDTVWYIADGKVESAELKAIRINVSAEMNGVLFEGIIPHGAYVYSWVIGQMLFLTREEAERSMKRGKRT